MLLPKVHVITSNRLEVLKDHLAGLLAAEPLSDPLSPEWLVIQTHGLEVWLRGELASRCGMLANARFFTPTGLLQVMHELRESVTPAPSPYEQDLLPWAVLSTLPSVAEACPDSPLAAYMRDADPGRIWSLAAKAADCLDQYATYRPDLLVSWEEGRLFLDGDTHEEWQAALWRALRRNLGDAVPPHRRLGDLLKLLQDAAPGSLPGLPPRILAFGLSILPDTHLELLTALARHIPVRLYLLNPCQEYWFDILSEREAAREMMKLPSWLDRNLAHLDPETQPPLLGNNGKLGREFFGRLLNLDLLEEAEEAFLDPAVSTEEPTCVLQVLQSDILHARPSGEAGCPPLRNSDQDGSILLSSSWGVRREVEALHNHLLHLLETLPGLRPGDIAVLVPDIEQYAPHVEAVFAPASADVEGIPPEEARRAGPLIPFTIADRPIVRESSLSASFQALLELLVSRMEFTRVWDLFLTDPLQERFPVPPESRDTLRDWLVKSGIRWGLSGGFRENLGLPGNDANTWEAGLQRLLLGFATAGAEGPAAIAPSPEAGEPPLWEGLLPFGEIEGSDAATLGTFLDFFHQLKRLSGEVRVERTPAGWANWLTECLNAVFDPDARPREASFVTSLLARLRQAETLAGHTGPVTFEVVRLRLEEILAKPFTTGIQLRGRATFCSLVPLRSLPFRVICLLGMNDGVFPRPTPAAGFDLVGRHPRPGDRNRRDADRYLFLETLLAARDHLYISWIGHDTAGGDISLPSTVVAELQQALHRYDLASSRPFPPERPVEHPLHSTSPRYDSAVDPRLFTYSRIPDRERITTPVLPLYREVLPPPGPEFLALSPEELTNFYRDPSRYFLRKRVGLMLPDEEETVDSETFALDRLQQHLLTREVVQGSLESRQIRPDLVAARGILPHGELGRQSLKRQQEAGHLITTELNTRTAGLAPLPPIEVDLRGIGPSGAFDLRGPVHGIWGKDGIPSLYLFWHSSALKGKTRLQAWIPYLALCAQGYTTEGVVLGTKNNSKSDPFPLPTIDSDHARILLDHLLHLYAWGLRRPLPLFPNTSCELVEAEKKGKHDRALQNAAKTWHDAFQNSEESGEWDKSAALRLLYRDVGTALLEDGSLDSRHDPDLAAAFQYVSRTVFRPIFGMFEDTPFALEDFSGDPLSPEVQA